MVVGGFERLRDLQREPETLGNWQRAAFQPLGERLRVAVPIWRDPWMVVGTPTYTDDLLARAGLVNVLAHGPAARDGRYPTVTTDDIDGAGADVVLLPDEPYVFTADDGPEALRTPTRLVSGRLLTWYGPAMVEAHAVLTAIGG